MYEYIFINRTIPSNAKKADKVKYSDQQLVNTKTIDS